MARKDPDLVASIWQESNDRRFRVASPMIEAILMTGLIGPLALFFCMLGGVGYPAVFFTLAAVLGVGVCFLWIRVVWASRRSKPTCERLDGLLDQASTVQLIELLEHEDFVLRVSASARLRGKLAQLDTNAEPGFTAYHYKIFARALGQNDVALIHSILEAVPILCDPSLARPIDKLVAAAGGSAIESALSALALGARDRLARRLESLGAELLRPSELPCDVQVLMRPAVSIDQSGVQDGLRPANVSRK